VHYGEETMIVVPTATSSPLIPVADFDGDVGNLADLIGGAGTSLVFDPGEASEVNEQQSLSNVGGMGEDMRPLTTLHGGAVGTLAMTQQQVGMSVLGGVAGSALPGKWDVIVGAQIGAYYGINSDADTLSGSFKQMQIQQDPFDSNYKQVYTPIVPPSLPPFPAFPTTTTLTLAQQTTLRNDMTLTLTAQGKVASDSDAVYVTQNRLFSAYQSGDLISFDLQNTTLNKYVSTLASDELAQGKAESALATDLSNDGADLTITPANITSFQNSLKTQGFSALPAQERSIIQTYLPNATDQQALVNQIVQVAPPSKPTSFVANILNQANIATPIGKALTVPPLTNTSIPPLSGSGPFANLPGGNNFSITDTSTNEIATTAGTPYSGPVVSLRDQLVLITTDNLNITAITPNAFIHSGSGEDALNVSQANGSNVLDGSTGSNFLTGGGGTDTFFVDDRGPTADIWSTVVNFHAGDAATIWGVTPRDFGLAWADGQGATGFTGLTLHATAAGQPTASLTLAGYTSADLGSGRLSVSFGSDPASGSAYMYVHGNS
jgi:hypothetical protein